MTVRCHLTSNRMGVIKKIKDSVTACFYMSLKHLPRALVLAHLFPKLIITGLGGWNMEDTWEDSDFCLWFQRSALFLGLLWHTHEGSFKVGRLI